MTKLFGAKHRPGLFQCNACREQFTVTVGIVHGAIKDRPAYMAQDDVLALRFKEGHEHALTPPDAGRLAKIDVVPNAPHPADA